MKIETREDALQEIMHILADCRQGKPVNFPQFLSDLETFLRNDRTVKELEKQIEELENQEPPITYSDIEAIMEPLEWAKHDLEDFRQTLHDFSDDLEDGVPFSWYGTIKAYLNDLQYDINSALDKIHCLIG